MHFDWPALVKTLSSQLGVQFDRPNSDVYVHKVPFSTRRSEKGAVVIQSNGEGEKGDPFAKTPLELKNWVRGVVWRDEFFNGTMIADIAKREKMDPRYVGRLIDASLSI